MLREKCILAMLKKAFTKICKQSQFFKYHQHFKPRLQFINGENGGGRSEKRRVKLIKSHTLPKQDEH